MRRLAATGAGSLVWLLPLLATGCISGRALNGYPGYPFVSFAVPQTPDSAFFRLQDALRDEGYPIDFTERASGFIKTRVAPDASRPVFLSVIVADRTEGPDSTDVWIGAYEVTSTGAKRINPLDETPWKGLVDVSGRISQRLGGTEPIGPAG